GPAAEDGVAQRVAAARAGDRLGRALDQLERPVAARAAPVAPVGAGLGQVDDGQILALATDREAAPELRAARLAPADVPLVGGVGAGGALVGDDRSHVRRRVPRTRGAVNPLRSRTVRSVLRLPHLEAQSSR